MVAYQIEGDLVQLLRPHYARTEDEGRTLIQAALRSPASLEPADATLNITLRPMSAPHRSKAIAGLCAALNESEAVFPGTTLRMHFGVAGQHGAVEAIPGPQQVGPSGQKADKIPRGYVRSSEAIGLS
jgi:hypothetical protein